MTPLLTAPVACMRPYEGAVDTAPWPRAAQLPAHGAGSPRSAV